MFNEQGAEAYGVAPSVSCLESTALASSVLAGAWRPVTAAPALEGSLLPTDFTAAAPDLAPERIARRLVGLRALPADGCTGLRWKRSATRR